MTDERPPLPDTDDPFELLGVDEDADEREVKRAYARLIRIYRPDESPAEFARIHEAFGLAKEGGGRLSSEPPPSENAAPSQAESSPHERLIEAGRARRYDEAWSLIDEDLLGEADHVPQVAAVVILIAAALSWRIPEAANVVTRLAGAHPGRELGRAIDMAERDVALARRYRKARDTAARWGTPVELPPLLFDAIADELLPEHDRPSIAPVLDDATATLHVCDRLFQMDPALANALAGQLSHDDDLPEDLARELRTRLERAERTPVLRLVGLAVATAIVFLAFSIYAGIAYPHGELRGATGFAALVGLVVVAVSLSRIQPKYREKVRGKLARIAADLRVPHRAIIAAMLPAPRIGLMRYRRAIEHDVGLALFAAIASMVRAQARDDTIAPQG